MAAEERSRRFPSSRTGSHVGEAVQQNVAGIYTPQGSPLTIFPFTVWGAVSNDFLKHYAYTVDFDAMKIVLASPPTPQSASLSPVQRIFDEAFRRWQTYPVPPYAIWTTTWHISAIPMGFYTGTSSGVEFHRYAVRLADGMENVSDPIPSGKLPPALILPEFLGPFAWVTRTSVRVAPTGGEVSMLPDVAGFKTIARVVAVAKPAYTIGNSAQTPPIEEVEGHETYHLRLEPRDDPQKHNLRDLWIDVRTYDLREGTLRRNVQADAQGTGEPDGRHRLLSQRAWLLGRYARDLDLHNAPLSFNFDVQNDEIGLPATLPDWLFDAAEYRKHQVAGEPDYLGILLDRLRKGGG